MAMDPALLAGAFFGGREMGKKKRRPGPERAKTPGELEAERHALDVAARRRRVGREDDEALHAAIDPPSLGSGVSLGRA